MDWVVCSPSGLPRWRWLYQPQVGVSHNAGGIDPGDHRFRPRFVVYLDDIRIYDLGMEPYPLRLALAVRTPDVGFHIVREPRGHRFRFWPVGVVHVWKDF